MISDEWRETHVAGGYALARPWTRPAWSTSPRLPASLFTASSSLAPIGPGPDVLSWVTATPDERARHLADLGLPGGELDAVAAWVEARHASGEWGWPSFFTSIDAARAFVETFQPRAPDLVILGLALPRAYLDRYVADHPADPGVGTFAIDEAIRRPSTPAPGGTPLGYEVLGEELGGSFHSWHWNDLEPLVHDRLGITANDEGLIDDLEAATAAAELIGLDEVGAEPLRWRPWLLVRHPLESAKQQSER